jgi:ABC-type nitrate/sulfonate/bicarbonate transport system permease component
LVHCRRLALIPLVIACFGVDEIAKLVILFYASFFTGVIVMYEGVSQITPLYIRVAQTLGAGELEIFRKVIIPLTVPDILTALRVALGSAKPAMVSVSRCAQGFFTQSLLRGAGWMLLRTFDTTPSRPTLHGCATFPGRRPRSFR